MHKTYAAEAAADEADPIAALAAELAEAAIPEAWLAALPISELKRVLEPVVVMKVEPAESVVVARRGTVVTALIMALLAAEPTAPVTDEAAEAAAPEALARAEVKMGTAAGVPADETAASAKG